MTAKLIPLAGLLLMLSSPVFAASDQDQTVQAQEHSGPTQTAQASQPPQQLAWQRVGAPLSLET